MECFLSYVKQENNWKWLNNAYIFVYNLIILFFLKKHFFNIYLYNNIDLWIWIKQFSWLKLSNLKEYNFHCGRKCRKWLTIFFLVGSFILLIILKKQLKRYLTRLKVLWLKNWL